MHLLLTHPEQLQAILADRSLVVNAVHEAMRFRPPVRGLMRKTTSDVNVGGIAIPAGSMVFISLASANRDSAVFDKAEQFDVRRDGAFKNLGFGSRTHACIGVNLARMEARIAVETLFERLPHLVLVEGQATMQYRPNLMLPAFKSLRVRW